MPAKPIMDMSPEEMLELLDSMTPEDFFSALQAEEVADTERFATMSPAEQRAEIERLWKSLGVRKQQTTQSVLSAALGGRLSPDFLRAFETVFDKIKPRGPLGEAQ